MFNIENFMTLTSVVESYWLIQNKMDKVELPKIFDGINALAKKQDEIKIMPKKTEINKTKTKQMDFRHEQTHLEHLYLECDSAWSLDDSYSRPANRFLYIYPVYLNNLKHIRMA